MARRLFSRRRRRRSGGLVVAALAAAAAAVFMSLAIAHPGHEEEDVFERWLAAVKAAGRACDEVVEIEDSGDVVIVTCRVQAADTGDQPVAYSLPK